MKKLFTLFSVILYTLALPAQTTGVPRESEDVMLQTFYWNSQTLTKYGRTKWVDLLKDTAAISQSFDMVWFPPSASGGGVGYYPKRWCDQSGDWGTTSVLKTLIASLHRGGTKVLADIVVNHHASSSGWGSFSSENFGSYGTYYLTQSDICAGDEAFTDSKSNIKGSSNHGAADTGDNEGGCRDLDHTSVNVQNCVKAYTQWMRTEMGYDGFRYDMVKGYHGRYVAMYNRASAPEFSVAECYDGSPATLKAYIGASDSTTFVFDFSAKFNAFNGGIAKSSYANLRYQTSKLFRMAGFGRFCVTFIDNHDTFERSDSQDNEFYQYNCTLTDPTPSKLILQANAYLLANPGVPCVFWPHWVTFRSEINAMIAARRAAGIHSESTIVSEKGANGATSGYYEAVIQGHRGQLCLQIGPDGKNLLKDKSADGFTLMASGTEYKMWVKLEATGLESSSELKPIRATKTIENGRLVITSGSRKYNALGNLIY